MEDALKSFQKKAPKIVKDNKGALIGAMIGYFLSDNEKAKSAIMGAIAGALIEKNTKPDDEDEE